jgi:hypothetical protein
MPIIAVKAVKAVKSVKAVKAKHTSMEPSSLLLEMLPEELLRKCAERLDAKSCAMVSSTCKTMHMVCKDVAINKTQDALGTMINEIVRLMVSIQNEISSEGLQTKLLADILRKLIFVSVSNAQNTDGTSRIAFTNCMSEYQRLQEYFADTMNLSWFEFNNLLEDSQFEFRGFNIIGLSQVKRDILDAFKQHLQSIYFSDSFIIHSYITLDNMSMELNYDTNEICFDIHKLSNPFERMNATGEWESSESSESSESCDTDSDGEIQSSDAKPGNSIFFQDLVSKWVGTSALKQEYNDSIISNTSDMLWWNPLDERGQNVPHLLGRMLNELMPCATSLLKGTVVTKIEFWNDTVEDNWLLTEVMNDFIRTREFQTTLSYITYHVVDVFNFA